MEVFSIASHVFRKDAGGQNRVALPPDIEHRSAVRVPAAEIPSITGLRLLPDDVSARLVNVSTHGLLAECTSPLKPSLQIRVRFEGTFSPPIVAGRVVRCTVASMGSDGVLRYHVGVQFEVPISLNDSTRSAGQPAELERARPTKASAAPAPAEPLRNRW
jgi:hypothetical protein